MPTEAQIAANRENSQHSTGPKSAEGKTVICLNAFRHGLAGAFRILPDESRGDFDELHQGLRAEHKPETPTETLLIESMAQHYWLKQRALRLQTFCFDDDGGCDEKSLALFLRYQTTHDRAFYKSLNTLLKLRADKQKSEIGFVSQQRQTEEHARKQAAEKRREELHKWKVLCAQAEVDHRIMLNINLQTPENRITVGRNTSSPPKKLHKEPWGRTLVRAGLHRAALASLFHKSCAPQARALPYRTSRRLQAFSACGSL